MYVQKKCAVYIFECAPCASKLEFRATKFHVLSVRYNTFFPPFIQASIGSLSEQSGHGLIKKHYMDIVGPLLPHTLRQLRALLDRAQLELVVHTVESSYTSAFTRALQDI